MRAQMPWLQSLPVICLLAVAAHQLLLVNTENLSPWSGGGFGMFSTTDAATDRHLHVYQLTPAMRRELRIPDYLEDSVRRALALPSERQLELLAAELVTELELADDTSLELLVWANQYDAKTLTPYSKLLKARRIEHARGR